MKKSLSQRCSHSTKIGFFQLPLTKASTWIRFEHLCHETPDSNAKVQFPLIPKVVVLFISNNLTRLKPNLNFESFKHVWTLVVHRGPCQLLRPAHVEYHSSFLIMSFLHSFLLQTLWFQFCKKRGTGNMPRITTAIDMQIFFSIAK